jgi:DNA-binding NarL/FixJ family response regulator
MDYGGVMTFDLDAMRARHKQKLLNPYEDLPLFDGAVIDHKVDQKPLEKQLKAIYNLMQDGVYRSLSDIATKLNIGESSVSAQLRNLRKERYGGFEVQKTRVDRLWLYRLAL